MSGCLAVSAVAMLDPVAVRAWWLRRLHPAGPMCPACGVELSPGRQENWAADGDVRCHSCGKWFNNRTGTPLSGGGLTWCQLFRLVDLAALPGTTPSMIAAQCRCSDDTVRRTLSRLGLRND